mmetsp:Transcript_9947/g.24194  ORF Transcript_9947/g.24194 Transcript_9947/m.24194 type:complete len:528 (+) Transcript_9947:375-1958(+)
MVPVLRRSGNRRADRMDGEDHPVRPRREEPRLRRLDVVVSRKRRGERKRKRRPRHGGGVRGERRGVPTDLPLDTVLPRQRGRDAVPSRPQPGGVAGQVRAVRGGSPGDRLRPERSALRRVLPVGRTDRRGGLRRFAAGHPHRRRLQLERRLGRACQRERPVELRERKRVAPLDRRRLRRPLRRLRRLHRPHVPALHRQRRRLRKRQRRRKRRRRRGVHRKHLGHHPDPAGDPRRDGPPAAGDLGGEPSDVRRHLALRRVPVLHHRREEPSGGVQPPPRKERRVGDRRRVAADDRLAGLDGMVLLGRFPGLLSRQHRGRQGRSSAGGRRRRGGRRGRRRGGVGPRRSAGRRPGGGRLRDRGGRLLVVLSPSGIGGSGRGLEAQRRPGARQLLRGDDPHGVGDPRFGRRRGDEERGQPHRRTVQHGDPRGQPVARPRPIRLDPDRSRPLPRSGFHLMERERETARERERKKGVGDGERERDRRKRTRRSVAPSGDETAEETKTEPVRSGPVRVLSLFAAHIISIPFHVK